MDNVNKSKKEKVESLGANARSLRVVGWSMAAGLVLMLGAAFIYMAEHPGLVVHTQPGSGMAASAESGDRPTGTTAGPEAQNAALMSLMERLQKNPQDMEALLSLAGHFLHTDDYARAENFAMRAVMAAQGTEASMPLYLLSVAQHGQKRYGEAADSLEKALALKDDSETRYSLGIVQRYFLKNEAKGRAELEKALAAPGITETLKKQIEVELEKPAPEK